MAHLLEYKYEKKNQSVVFFSVLFLLLKAEYKIMSITSVRSVEAPAPIGPYSQAIAAGGFLYISGQFPLDASTGLMVQHTIEAETHMVMKNIRSVLHAADLDFSNVVKVSIFVTDLANFALINSVYGSYLSETLPARETVQVSALPRNSNVEISCIALLKK